MSVDTTWHSQCGRRRAQYTVGMMLLFAIFFTTTMVTVGFAYQTIANQGESQSVSVVEGEMGTIASDASDIVRGAPARVSTVSLPGTRLHYGEPVELSVSASTSGGRSFSRAMESRLLVATVEGDTKIVYGLGAVSRLDGGRGAESVLLGRPALRTTSERTAIFVPQIRPKPSSATSVGGDAAQDRSIRLLQTSVTSYRQSAPSGTQFRGYVTVDDTGSQEVVGAWVSFFEASGFEARDLDGDGQPEYASDLDGDGTPEVRAFFESTALFVKDVDIQVALGRADS